MSHCHWVCITLCEPLDSFVSLIVTPLIFRVLCFVFPPVWYSPHPYPLFPFPHLPLFPLPSSSFCPSLFPSLSSLPSLPDRHSPPPRLVYSIQRFVSWVPGEHSLNEVTDFVAFRCTFYFRPLFPCMYGDKLAQSPFLTSATSFQNTCHLYQGK